MLSSVVCPSLVLSCREVETKLYNSALIALIFVADIRPGVADVGETESLSFRHGSSLARCAFVDVVAAFGVNWMGIMLRKCCTGSVYGIPERLVNHAHRR